jgi:hypothetical protein
LLLYGKEVHADRSFAVGFYSVNACPVRIDDEIPDKVTGADRADKLSL